MLNAIIVSSDRITDKDDWKLHENIIEQLSRLYPTVADERQEVIAWIVESNRSYFDREGEK